MKRAIWVIRLCGYSTGALGAGVLLTARRIPLSFDARERWLAIGAGLLLTMFLCFLAGYVFHIARMFRGK